MCAHVCECHVYNDLVFTDEDSRTSILNLYFYIFPPVKSTSLSFSLSIFLFVYFIQDNPRHKPRYRNVPSLSLGLFV